MSEVVPKRRTKLNLNQPNLAYLDPMPRHGYDNYFKEFAPSELVTYETNYDDEKREISRRLPVMNLWDIDSNGVWKKRQKFYIAESGGYIASHAIGNIEDTVDLKGFFIGGIAKDEATIEENAVMTSGRIEEHATLGGHSRILGAAVLRGYAKLLNCVEMQGCAEVKDDAVVAGHAKIDDYVVIDGDSRVTGFTTLRNAVHVHNSDLDGITDLSGNLKLDGLSLKDIKGSDRDGLSQRPESYQSTCAICGPLPWSGEDIKIEH